MVKIAYLLVFILLGSAIAVLADAQESAFSQSCSTVSFGPRSPSGTIGGAQVLYVPCQKAGAPYLAGQQQPIGTSSLISSSPSI